MALPDHSLPITGIASPTGDAGALLRLAGAF
jgi:hypothetical protein